MIKEDYIDGVMMMFQNDTRISQTVRDQLPAIAELGFKYNIKISDLEIFLISNV